MMDVDDIFLCHQCGKIFYKLSTFESHTKWKHKKKSSDFMCDQCGRTFQKKYNLIKHIDSGYHGISETVKCAVCDFRAQNRKIMGEHYQKFHRIHLKESSIYFTSVLEFYTWKSEYENKTKSRYVKMSSSRQRKNGFVRSTYFCHRDGNFIPKGKNLRHPKIKGSNKINAHCPAKMEVDISDRIVIVTYIDTHLGHELDITRMTLCPEDRALIAEKLALKVPFEKILEEINHSSKNRDLKRVNLLTRKDLWNIVDTFKINPKAVVYSKTRIRKNQKVGKPKKEFRRNCVFYKVFNQDSNNSFDENEVAFNNDEREDQGSDQLIPVKQENKDSVIFCPVIIKDGDNEYTQEYALISDENAEDAGTCLVINADGELESISGHRVIYTEGGDLEICATQTTEKEFNLNKNLQTNDISNKISVFNEEELYDNSLEETICDKSDPLKMDASEMIEIPVVHIGRKVGVYRVAKNNQIERNLMEKCEVNECPNNHCQNNLERKPIMKAKSKTDFCTEEPNLESGNIEKDNDQQSPFVEDVTIEHNPNFEVIEGNFEGLDVNEYVIISTEEDLSECSVMSSENNVQITDEPYCPVIPLDSFLVNGINADVSEEIEVKAEIVDSFIVCGEECVEDSESSDLKWSEKSKQIFNMSKSDLPVSEN